jgi:hypothetical protein
MGVGEGNVNRYAYPMCTVLSLDCVAIPPLPCHASESMRERSYLPYTRAQLNLNLNRKSRAKVFSALRSDGRCRVTCHHRVGTCTYTL